MCFLEESQFLNVKFITAKWQGQKAATNGPQGKGRFLALTGFYTAN